MMAGIGPRLEGVAARILRLLTTHCTTAEHLYQIQAQLIVHHLHSNTTIAAQFIAACDSLNLLNSNALPLYTTYLPKPHTFICNTLLKAFSHSRTPRKSLLIFSHMYFNSILVNNFTFPFVLKALAELKELRQGELVHVQILKLGLFYDIYVGNSLMNLYASCGDVASCKRVFDEMCHRDVVSWTVLIMGLKNAGKSYDALMAFERMRNAGILPNRVTMVNALDVCSSCGALDLGIWIHDFVERSGWELDVILGTSLIDMYAKCGRIQKGLNIFNKMLEKNVFTWNAIIKGLALAKSGKEAVRWFLRMQQAGVKPDDVSLIAVLCACVHSGLVHIGRKIFTLLIKGKYGFPVNVKHYACMVDLLARAGCLEEAFRMIKDMPFDPTQSIWGALLAGCRAHGNLELCEFVAWKLVEMTPTNFSHYVVLSNLYAETGRWSDVEKVRNLMVERGLAKDPGSSSFNFEHQDVLQLLA